MCPSSSRRTPSLESILRLIEKAELEDDSDLQKLVQQAATSERPYLKRQLMKLLATKVSQRQLYPFDLDDVPSVPVPMQPKIRIGSKLSGGSYTLQPDAIDQHLLAVGQSGSGKTTLFYNLMAQIDRPFWAFDLKQDYRHLTEKENILVLPWQEFRFNPLRPPEGVSPRRWAQVFTEMFGHSTSLLSGSKNYLLKKIVELYKLYGLFDDVSDPYPSLHELQLLVKSDSMNYVRKASDYRETVLNRLEAMNLTSGTVFDCSTGYRPEELLERDVVFEFDGLSRDVQNFLMEALFAFVYEYRLAQNHRDQGLNHLFFLDEGKRVFSVYKERQEASGIPEIDELTAKMREFGEGLVVADQEASKLTDSIKANTYTKVLLSMGDRKQFNAVTEAMDLSERQEEFASSLEVGEAVVQQGGGEPVPVDLDNYELEKSVDDRELRKLMGRKWAELSYTERELSETFQNEIAPGRSENVEEPEVPSEPTDIELSSEAERFLKNVADKPFQPLTERYSEFSSRYKGNKVKNEAVEQGLLIERSVHEKQGSKKLLQFTEKGREYLEDSLDFQLKRKGRGSITHRYWQHRIKQAFEEAGWHAFLEKFDADVYVNMGNTELVVEVAMGDNPREVEHVEKHLDTGFTVWVAPRNKEVMGGLKQRMAEQGLDLDQLSFRPVRQFNELEIT